jgi:type IV secretory pathway VirJ component
MGRRPLIIGAITAALGLPFLAMLAGVGYFGGTLFFDRPARNASPPGTEETAAVLLSGNMGFHWGQAVKVSDALAARGIPVLGVNSLAYFRRPRSPDDAATLIERAIERAERFSGRRRVTLIGISFGADVLQVGLARLPQPWRTQVRNVVLVVPGDTVEMQASPYSLFPISTPKRNGLETGRELDWTPVTCIYGAAERDSLCPRLSLPRFDRVPLPGGHLLNGDIAAMADRLVRAIAEPPGLSEAATPPGSAVSPPAPPAG